MEKIIKIEGMMCAHCENHVKTALEKTGAVESAEVSAEAGTAVVTLSADADEAMLRHAVENEGYTVVSIASL